MQNKHRPLWLDNSPAGWQLVPLGSLFRERNEATTALADAPLSVTKSGVVDQLDQVAISVDGAPKKRVHRGDIVINSRSDRKGSSGEAPRCGSVSVINTVLIPQQIYSRFAHHLMRSTGFQEEFYRFGSGIVADLWSTRWSAMKNILLPLPPISMQQRIADYLDHETAEIDAFLDDQASLLELLEEKISSQITAATSHGLGAHEPFSGRWYPQLGAGWRTTLLKSVSAKLTDGAHISPVTENGTYPFVSTKDVKRGKIDTLNCLRTDASSAEYMMRTGCKPESGDVLFSKDGTVGESAIVGQDAGFVIASSLVIIRPNPRIMTSPFLRMALLSHPVREQARAFMKGAGLPRISVANVGRLIIPVPGMDEQRQIVAFLAEQMRQADELRQDITQLMTLARERRAALITAAVTGQIDVTARNKPAAEQLEDDIAQGLHREN